MAFILPYFFYNAFLNSYYHYRIEMSLTDTQIPMLARCIHGSRSSAVITPVNAEVAMTNMDKILPSVAICSWQRDRWLEFSTDRAIPPQHKF